jgi:hypothetical protein
MKLVMRQDIMIGKPYQEGMEDGFEYFDENNSSLGCFPSDHKITGWHHKVPFIQENGSYTNLIFITKPSWILTHWTGGKMVVTDEEVKLNFVEFTE